MGGVWISSGSPIAKEKPPSKYNALLAIDEKNHPHYGTMGLHMQVTMDYAPRKNRRANKVLEEGGKRLLVDKRLA